MTTTFQQSQQETQTSSDGDLFGEMTGERIFSADIVIDEDTGTPEIIDNLSPAGKGREPLSESDAMKQTETLMDMRETAQSLALSYIAEGDLSRFEAYKYEPWQKRLLVEAWTPLIQQWGLRVNPFIKILYAEGISTGPIAMLAINNRKQRLRIEEQAQEISRLRNENSSLKTNNIVEFKTRNDAKNLWLVDEAGYFQYTPAGKYIKKDERSEKPDLSPDNYKQLVKYNGKAEIDKIFNIQ